MTPDELERAEALAATLRHLKAMARVMDPGDSAELLGTAAVDGGMDPDLVWGACRILHWLDIGSRSLGPSGPGFPLEVIGPLRAMARNWEWVRFFEWPPPADEVAEALVRLANEDPSAAVLRMHQWQEHVRVMSTDRTSWRRGPRTW